MHYIICCSPGVGGRVIWSLQRGWSLLGEVVNRSFTVLSQNLLISLKIVQKGKCFLNV